MKPESHHELFNALIIQIYRILIEANTELKSSEIRKLIIDRGNIPKEVITERFSDGWGQTRLAFLEGRALQNLKAAGIVEHGPKRGRWKISYAYRNGPEIDVNEVRKKYAEYQIGLMSDDVSELYDLMDNEPHLFDAIRGG